MELESRGWKKWAWCGWRRLLVWRSMLHLVRALREEAPVPLTRQVLQRGGGRLGVVRSREARQDCGLGREVCRRAGPAAGFPQAPALLVQQERCGPSRLLVG